MAKKIPIEQLDEFCDRLFRVLDRADLLPLRLNEAPHSFEKYGRLLAGLIGRYDRVEAAFDEWQTRALRGIKSQSRREELHPYFQELRDWLTATENRQLFEGSGRRDNLNHFKRSLYARVYTWLYPRRKLAMAYIQAHKGTPEQFEPEVIQRQFTSATYSTTNVDHKMLSDAQAYLVINSSRFKKWKAETSLDIEPIELDAQLLD